MTDPIQPKWYDRLIPPFSVVMSIALFVITWWILWILSPAKGTEPSELFKLLAQAVVLTAFIGGAVGAIFTVSRDGQKKNDIIAQQAQAIASQASAAPAGTTTTTTTTTDATPAPGTATITAAPNVDVQIRDAEEPAP